MAFGTEEELLEAGDAAPKEFIVHRDECVIVMSDQVPCFCMAKSGAQLYGEDEYRKQGTKLHAEPKASGATMPRVW